MDNYDLWLSDPIQKISVIFDLSTGEAFRITKELDSYDAFEKYRTSSVSGKTLADAQLLVATNKSNIFYLMKDNALADPLDVVSKMATSPGKRSLSLSKPTPF